MDEAPKPKRENFVECPDCTKAAGGDVVLIHKSLLVKSDEMFGEGGYECPKGHQLKNVKI